MDTLDCSLIKDYSLSHKLNLAPIITRGIDVRQEGRDKIMAKPRMNIRTLRKARGMTLTEFACRCDVSIASARQWEVGISFPSADKLPIIAAILGCTIDDLYDMAAYGDTIMLYDDEPSICRKEA